MAAANNHGAVPAVDIVGLRKVVLLQTESRVQPGTHAREKQLPEVTSDKRTDFNDSVKDHSNTTFRTPKTIEVIQKFGLGA